MSENRFGGITVLFVMVALATFASPAYARPAYGVSCVSCHGGDGFGNTVDGAMMSVVGTSQSTIPAGQFGDPDRGEGPLAAFLASPGGTFNLVIALDDPSDYSIPFDPEAWGIVFSHVSHTDPDFQTGNPDPLSWRDDQLLLVGALEYGVMVPPEPAPLPLDESEWTLYTDSSTGVQYYGSTGEGGHAWSGPLSLMLTVTVPGGVLPGWYDLEASIAGWDYGYSQGSFAFYDDEHFYLNVVPEPGAVGLVGIGALLLLNRRRNRNRRHAARGRR